MDTLRMERLGHLLAVVAAVFLAVWADPASGQTIEAEIDRTRARLEAARNLDLDVISPSHFERAAERFAQAEERFSNGGKIEDIRKRLGSVNESLETCEGFEEIGTVLLRDALSARRDATKAKASEQAKGPWTDAEDKIREAGRKVEGGDQNGARKASKLAETLYRDAELLAIRTDLFSAAWEKRAAALEAKSDELASVTLARADELLAEAESGLKEDRYARDRAEELAAQAATEFRHANKIAELVQKMQKDKKNEPERVIKSYEYEISRVAEALGIAPDFSEGPSAVMQQVLDANRKLIHDSEERIGSLRAENQELRASLGGLEQEFTQTNTRLATLRGRDAELQVREKHERRLQEVQRVFLSDEADVFLQGSLLIIRMHGLRFPVGSSEIRPDNFGLLKKVKGVLEKFPQAAITVEGHTDSRGNDASNQFLSQERASAVRQYILATMDMQTERITAIGFGESRPISNNETEDGRARNRRIDLTVKLPK